MNCDIGSLLDEDCDFVSSSKDPISDLTAEEIEIIRRRCGLTGCLTNLCAGHTRKYLKQYASHNKACCDPFSKHTKQILKNVREISLSFCLEHSSLNLVPGKKLCHHCRIHVLQSASASESFATAEKESLNSSTSNVSITDPSLSSGSEEIFQDTAVDVLNLNKSLHSLGESPLSLRKLHRNIKYGTEKVEQMTGTLRKRLRMDKSDDVQQENVVKEQKQSKYFQEIMKQLKEKFEKSKRYEKLQLLTVVPQSWSIRQTQQEFDAPNYMVRKAKELFNKKGILSTPNPKPGKPLIQSTVDLVKEFYLSDEISRQMPGIKDVVSVVVDGERKSLGKRLILCTINEAHRKFKTDNPSIKVGISKFTELRPKQVVLPGSSGTHNVCVCTIHENVKLMIEGARLWKIFGSDKQKTCTYKDFLCKITCNPPTTNCNLNKCQHCKTNIVKLEETLKKYFEDEGIDQITYKLWLTVDRTTLETVIKKSDDFVATYLEKLEKLLQHDFIAKQQSLYLKKLKESELSETAIIIADFAENYSFILQDAVQGFHWTNSQATIHPFIVYHKFETEADETPNLKHENFVIVSDTLRHDTNTVHCFQRKVLDFLKIKFPLLKKVVYFTDGAAGQYKNRKNFLNLMYHKQDFDLYAEWHFFATSHGKGPCDGLGGTVKRLAARASLQKIGKDGIQTPKELYDWATTNIRNINFSFVLEKEVEEECALLKKRFESAIPIRGTHKYHCFVPEESGETHIKVSEFSASLDYQKVLVCDIPYKQLLHWDELRGFVTCKYNNQWWLSCILDQLKESDEVMVTFLHPAGPSRSFKYPSNKDELVVPCDNILTKVYPSTATGRTYQLTSKEQQNASHVLNM